MTFIRATALPLRRLMRPSSTMMVFRSLSSPPAGSPVMVGIPKEFTRGPEDKRLDNHTGEESIVSEP